MRDALAGRHYVADYVQTLTHELKSPLSAIRGAAELLREPGMPEADRQRFIANIGRETQRIQELVDRMMELAALRAAPRARTDRAGGVAPAAGRARRQRRGRRRAAPSCAWCSTTAATCASTAIALLLRRAVGNLLDNAIDFSPDGGTIALALTRKGRRVDVTVRDHGPGIPRLRRREGVREVLFAGAPAQQAQEHRPRAWRSSKRSPSCTAAASTLRNADGGGALATLNLPCADAPR